MLTELSQIRRYELKYTITEEKANQIREYIQNICTLDNYVPPGEIGYIVNNLYFDTPDLRFYHDTKFRKLTRYKPRARYYGNKAFDFIFPEIKYRNASIIWKRRYCLPIEEWPDLFNPQKIDRREPIIKTQLDTFDEVIYWYHAQPVLHVRYFREPYVTELEEYGRVTFDRQLCCRPTRGDFSLDYNEQDLLYYDDPVTSTNYDSLVILEIKVETLIPQWTIELIRKFNLVQRAFSKYCYGIDYVLGYLNNGRISKLL